MQQPKTIQKEDLRPYYTFGFSLIQLLTGIIGMTLVVTAIWEFLL